ncbi:MAG TPA: M20/M25/M40 family metallo-hydrolase [bacterium]|nr:M20/M25/M40 family metallo-hydrolase [bacterium]
MTGCRPLVLLLLTILLFPPLPAGALNPADSPAPCFSGAKAFANVEELCKPEYGGRFTGHPGATRAAEWIGRQFENWGLVPAGDDRGWLQFYPMLVTEQLERAKLTLKNGAFGPVDYQEGNDFTVYMNSGSGKVRAELLFAGFGISEPAMGWDDYAGVDAKGKIVLIQRGLPVDGQDWSFANERDYKMRTAAAHGAVGLLMLERDDWPVRGGTIHEEGYQPNLPALNVSKKLVRDLFHGTFKDPDLILRDLPKKPNSLVLDRTLQLQVRVRRIEPGRGENVVALLPGSDPLLREEYLVIGGHMDHCGVGRDGHIYAGADDNASGTAVVMELARLFAARPERPKRSLLFIAFGGEEQGLRGSRYFAHNPPVPARQIAAMINFDMEGSGDGGARLGGRNYFPGLVRSMIGSWSDSVLAKTGFGRGWGGSGSDHFHFIEQGISAFYFSSSGSHPFYHQFEDQPCTLNTASLQSVGDRAEALIMALANQAEPLTLDNAGRGRFFLRHGDQLDLCGCTAALKGDLAGAVAVAHDAGIHFTTLTLDGGEEGKAELFSRLDSLEQWIAAHPQHLARYENGGTIDRAAGQGKLAVGIRLKGTRALRGEAAVMRQLGRLGLNILTIDSPEDPLWAEIGNGKAGKALLRAAETASMLLHVDLADTSLAGALLTAWKGRAVWSLDLAAAAAMPGAVARRLADGKAIALLRCRPEDDPGGLLELAAQLPSDRIHISVLGSPESRELKRMEGFVSTLHSLAAAKMGREESYKQMEKWCGRNIRRILQP